MKKLAILGLLVAAAGAAYAGSSWYFGTQVESTLANQYSRLLETTPYVQIVQRDYQRGVFESEETLTLELFKQIFDAMAKENDDPSMKAMEPLRLTVHTRIQHGPFPGLQTLAMAVVDSELVVPDSLKQDVSKLLGGQSPFSQHTTLLFDGSGYASFSSPKVNVTLPQDESGDALTLTWQGLQGDLNFSADMKRINMSAQAPQLMLAGNEIDIRFNDIRLEGDQQRIFDDIALLFSGSQRLSIGEIAFSTPDNSEKPFVLKRLTYDVDLPSQGEYVDLVERLGVESVQFGEELIGPLHIDYSLKHLHARSIAEISQAFMKMYTDPALFVGDEEALVEQFMPVLTEHGVTILNNTPEFHLDRVSFANAQGESSIKGRVKLKEFDLEAVMQNPFLLLANLEASGEISLTEAMIMDLLNNPPGAKEMATPDLSPEELQAEAQRVAEEFQQQMAMLAEQGYVIREGGLLKSKLELKEGQLLVNGKPFMPMADAGAMDMPPDGDAPMETDPSLLMAQPPAVQ